MYGENEGTYYEYDLAKASDECDFNANLESLQQKWVGLIPGYFKWFLANRKKLFVESVSKSARDGTNAHGFYYQYDIKGINAVQKCI